MLRLRPVFTAACLTILFMTLLPAAGLAQRGAERDSAIGQTTEDSPVGAFFAWGRGALGWIQALIAAEHGSIVPLEPPPPTPVPPGPPGTPALTPAP